jgi:hypothetical protein
VTLSVPPLRPGSTYYLGFWSSNSSVFTISSTNIGGTVIFSNTIPFSGAMTVTNLPVNGSLSYRIDVPPNATRLLFNASNAPGVFFSVEQGTPARPAGPAHWYSASPLINLERDLTPGANWPWLPGYSYFLTITNTSDAPQNIMFALGRIFSAAPVTFRMGTGPNSYPLMSVSGQLGTYYVIEASTDMKEWTPIYTNTTVFDFADPDVPNFPYRFYRTKVVYP